MKNTTDAKQELLNAISSNKPRQSVGGIAINLGNRGGGSSGPTTYTKSVAHDEQANTLTVTNVENGSQQTPYTVNLDTRTTNYNELENKPSINNVTLSGNKTTSDLDIELKINTDFTSYTPGTTAPRITPDDFGRIIASKCAINLVVSTNDETNKTSTFKVIYKSTDGYNNKLSFIIKGIVDNVEKTYFYYMPDNSTVAVRIMEYADQIEFNAVKNSYIKDIAWNNANLFITYGDDSTQSIMRNAHIYRHYYTLRPTTAFVYETISFTIDLPTPTPLTTNTLRAWFTASPFWDTNGANYIGKPLYPCSGIVAISNNIPVVATGLCYYVEQDGMILNVELRCYGNYGAVYSIDESTLHCSGVYNLTNGEWV